MTPEAQEPSTRSDLFSDINREFCRHSIGHLHDFLNKIERCLSELNEDQIWWRPNSHCNSVGNLVLHLSGNLRQWVISGVGGSPDVRQRNLEFELPGGRSAEELAQTLRKTVEEATEVIQGLDDAQLLAPHHIQLYHVTTLQAVLHVVEHFSHHAGQIIYITKLLRDLDLEFYAELKAE